MSTKVTLRRKEISQKRYSLYLDFYPPIVNSETGKLTRREFLKMYIPKSPKTNLEKQQAKETILIAENICAKRQNLINKPEIYTAFEKEQLRLKELGEKSFLEYFQQLTDKREKNNHDNWRATLLYLKKFSNNKLQFKDLNERLLNDFKEYLLTTKSNKSSKSNLSQNSAQSYFNKVKAALKQAYKEDLLQKDLGAMVQGIKTKEVRREYLTLEELNSLARTSCNNPMLKTAALFSALTGLRHSDISKLKWNEIEYIEGEGYTLQFTQKKTKGVENLPVSEQAIALLGPLKNSDTSVFENFKYSAYQNKHLYQWIGAAGITKNITFHCFRHTYATLQLFNGTDIYTVSKLLGHKNLKTTQIYAKVVDAAKRKAADKIIIEFPNES